MRALVRFRPLLTAIALPFCVVVLGMAAQGVAFDRPSDDALSATDVLRELLRFRVMRATEHIGRDRLNSTCLQGWYHAAHHRHLVQGALVLLGNGEKLYEVGNGVRRIGKRGPVGKVDLARFFLAGCPRFIGERIGARLIGSHRIDVDPSRALGSATLRLSFGERAEPINLYVARTTNRPVEIRLSSARLAGSSHLFPGGGAAAAVRVQRAYHLKFARRNQRA